MNWFELVASSLIVLHAPDGREVRINPDQVTSLRASHASEPNKLLTQEARCMVNLTDGKYVAVSESCAEVAARLRGEQ